VATIHRSGDSESAMPRNEFVPPKLPQVRPKVARQSSVLNEICGDSTLAQIYASMFYLFVPTFVARLAWIGMKTTDTALLGHSGTVFLTASSLSDFWTSASGVFLNDTLLGSLCGQAYGAKNYDLVGIWLQVSLTVFSWVLIPVVIMWLSTAPILQMAVGTDVEVAKDAGYYSMVMACCLPATMLSSRLTTFFASQKITGPSSQTTPLALLLNLGLGLQFVLGIPYSNVAFGFWACPVVTTSVEWFVTAMLLVVYCGYLGSDNLSVWLCQQRWPWDQTFGGCLPLVCWQVPWEVQRWLCSMLAIA